MTEGNAKSETNISIGFNLNVIVKLMLYVLTVLCIGLGVGELTNNGLQYITWGFGFFTIALVVSGN